VTRIGEVGTTLAVTSNRRTLRRNYTAFRKLALPSSGEGRVAVTLLCAFERAKLGRWTTMSYYLQICKHLRPGYVEER
jgi:hypothetical protein